MSQGYAEKVLAVQNRAKEQDIAIRKDVRSLLFISNQTELLNHQVKTQRVRSYDVRP